MYGRCASNEAGCHCLPFRSVPLLFAGMTTSTLLPKGSDRSRSPVLIPSRPEIVDFLIPIFPKPETSASPITRVFSSSIDKYQGSFGVDFHRPAAFWISSAAPYIDRLPFSVSHGRFKSLHLFKVPHTFSKVFPQTFLVASMSLPHRKTFTTAERVSSSGVY